MRKREKERERENNFYFVAEEEKIDDGLKIHTYLKRGGIREERIERERRWSERFGKRERKGD